MRSIVVSSSGWGGGLPSSARLHGSLPLQERCSLASQWLYQEPFALLRCSIDTWCSGHQSAGLAGAVPLAGAWPWLGGCCTARARCTACWIRACTSTWETVAGGVDPWGGGTGPWVASRCWRRVSRWACRSRAWSTRSCTHGTRCCTRLVSSASLTSLIVYMISISPTRSRRQQLAGASLTSQRSALGRRSWLVGSARASGVAARGGAALAVDAREAVACW